ncbi:putative nucleoside-diphosphate sugar epimerase [Leptolyngbya sp. BL0902]|uniref:polysaccharide biosynthesis protein n=1 Tax=Leptolyngbya sp. BL0902 TaxID=1115757 RepID=UPI0019390CD3|nr:nucleoside-diphosphate sugar epimerase/dehydratase [Leptolyngbya sp. BL0902]QQE65693.1 putative nucleoside-diphosphate sugar epimerase [Leptolyngbya sp. BL0902]
MGLFRKLATLPRRAKLYILWLTDVFAITLALYIAICLTQQRVLSIDELSVYEPLILLNMIVKTLVFYAVGLHRSVLKYISPDLLWKGVGLSSIAFGFLLALVPYLDYSFILWINDLVWTFLLVLGVRSLAQFLVYSEAIHNPRRPLIIYGAGTAGSQLAKVLSSGREFRIVAFVDDNPQIQSHLVGGIMVYNPVLLPKLINDHGVETLLLAMPSVPRQEQASILDSLSTLPVTVKTVPTLEEIISGKTGINALLPVSIKDLLNRDEVLPDESLLAADIAGKAVLVTGAGGSIGSELCRQIALQSPQHLILYELNEFALYKIDLELSETFPDLACTACLGSVTDSVRLEAVLKQHRVNTIYHAAAYKHVPLVEYNAGAAVVNNVLGTQTVAEVALKQNIGTFVLISTDKAVRPTNVMGATKRVAELILQAIATHRNTTRFSIVRFGNVLGSTGSVVPRFSEQIRSGKAVTVTHPDVTRYFMSIPEAARLVIQAGAMGLQGEVFLLDMGKPVKIYDLAKQMIHLSGLTPNVDVAIEITGLRPGEKLYEELLIDRTKAAPTQHPKIFMAQDGDVDPSHLYLYLDLLLKAATQNDTVAIKKYLKVIVPEYQPKDNAVLLASEQIKQESNWVV